LSFLQECRDSYHSIVVVGSAAHGAHDSGSDVDVVVICKKEGFETVQNAVCEKELNDAFGSRRDPATEYTLLNAPETQGLFRTASPFAYALRHGALLEDDGYLRNLAEGRHPRAPGRKYVLTALYESIIVPYYGSFRALEKNALMNRCTRECCADRAWCGGLPHGGTPARVIMRMLYVTLPLKGCMPLTKGDVVFFAAQVYGEESGEIARTAADMARNDAAPVSFIDYQRFKRFAGTLFREILGVAGSGRAVRTMLRDGASMVQGKSWQVKDGNLRKCVQ
jgi:predicted nucleotidyltransferase